MPTYRLEHGRIIDDTGEVVMEAHQTFEAFREETRAELATIKKALARLEELVSGGQS